MAQITYTIDGTDISTLGVRVSASHGILDGLKMKDPLTMDWVEYHGQAVDLSAPRYEARTISLDCWIAADGRVDFITQVNALLALLDKAGLRRLVVGVDSAKPLVYDVYRAAAVAIDKQWSDSEMFGTFTLTLIEPEPIKKILKYTRTGDADKQISITFESVYNIHVSWGDGTTSDDIQEGTVTHDYEANGTYLIAVHGNIDDLTSFTTTATTVWSRL